MTESSIEAKRVGKMLWAIIGLTVVITIGVNLSMGWGITNQRDQLAELANETIRFAEDESTVRFELGRGRLELIKLLNLDETVDEDAGTASIVNLQRSIESLTTPQILSSSEHESEQQLSRWEVLKRKGQEFSRLLVTVQLWRSRNESLNQNIRDKISLDKVRNRLQDLHGLINDSAGRERIRSSLQIRQYQKAKASAADKLAREIVATYLEKLRGGRDNLQIEIASIQQLVEVLDGVDQYDLLADIKDNKLKPVLVRLQRDMEAVFSNSDINGELELEALRVSLFGDNYNIDEKHQTIHVSQGGFYTLRRDFLSMLIEKDLFKEELEALVLDIEQELGRFVLLEQNRQKVMDQRSTDELTATWIWVLALSFIGGVIFLFLIRKVFSAIEKQVAALDLLRERAEKSRMSAETALNKLDLAQETLVQSEKMAALGTLVAGVAHEVNTPIGICVTATSTLVEETEKLQDDYNNERLEHEGIERFFEMSKMAEALISSNLSRARDLIKSFKQVAVGQHVDDRATFELLSFIEESMLSIKHELKMGKHKLNISGTGSTYVHVTPNHIWQVASNLVLNAVRHAFKDRTEGTINIEVGEMADSVFFSVEDDGHGMDEETMKKCFDPFYTTAKLTGGSGLGLSIVHSLITEGLGGSIDVEYKNREKGVKFIVSFPSGLDDEQVASVKEQDGVKPAQGLTELIEPLEE
ncbi:sensor histidine kinase [Shewanella woodyi]|uniref:histidine kinase n=1 Tax=Shewanella woodyi (strain ATCC 51908 / MS32) TaxID=392500 RepID=B1KFT1_SHEWM|nr:HAMP domain-containing sensor histidine kinase [Shewanella woodyi]ACA85247.1 integral membrane sensor signal transduction histidine kinase [Shewanella woodyi ATCC 51908]